jgi:hypothetical protein
MFNGLQQQEQIQRLLFTQHVTRRDVVLNIDVSRENIVENTISVLSRTADSQLLKKLMVTFKGEQGVDAGGVSREFFYLLCNELFDPVYGMFKAVPGNKYWFNAATVESPIYFNVLGTVVALALYNFVMLPIRFPRLLYKKLCGRPVGLSDLSEIDEELVESFARLRKLKSDGVEVSASELTFAVTVESYDTSLEIPLKPDGGNISVTNENLEEYIALYVDYMLNKSVEKQFEAFSKGFMKLCNHPLFRIFGADELDIMVSGVEVLDWDDLQTMAEYTDGYTSKSNAVKWFWEIFRELTPEQKGKFLRFSTGSDRTPIGGLSEVHLVIQKTGDTKKLPVSHTCFNILGLPDYKSKEEMRRKLLIALEYHEGFGLI